MSTTMIKSVKISERTWKKLTQLGGMTDSFDDVIEGLADAELKRRHEK